MGIFSKAKAETAENYARKAWDNGDAVYVVQIRAGFMHTNDLSRPIPDMGQQVAAIESVGWTLDRCSWVDSNDKATMYCLFRR